MPKKVHASNLILRGVAYLNKTDWLGIIAALAVIAGAAIAVAAILYADSQTKWYAVTVASNIIIAALGIYKAGKPRRKRVVVPKQ